jgi:hypothetical protein
MSLTLSSIKLERIIYIFVAIFLLLKRNSSVSIAPRQSVRLSKRSQFSRQHRVLACKWSYRRDNCTLKSTILVEIGQIHASGQVMRNLWGCWFLFRICCSDTLLRKLSRRSQNHVRHANHHVPRFSDAWSWATLVATLVCFSGLSTSRSSWWPFPEFYNCFFSSFNDIQWCDLFRGGLSVNSDYVHLIVHGWLIKYQVSLHQTCKSPVYCITDHIRVQVKLPSIYWVAWEAQKFGPTNTKLIDRPREYTSQPIQRSE